jgi:DNA-binding response OmpR family regulator
MFTKHWKCKTASVRVLIIEDEDVMAHALAAGLKRAAFAVDVCLDGQSGLATALETTFDVIVLDRDLPLLHGDDVCRKLVSQRNSARILMLTAASSTSSLVEGLNLGADDYLAKPFAFAELVARVTALARRYPSIEAVKLIVGDLVIDTTRKVAQRGGIRLDLTAKEIAILIELVKAEGSVLSAEDLLHRLWDDQADPFTNAVRVAMVGLRRKLGEPQLISTVRGVGYRILSAVSQDRSTKEFSTKDSSVERSSAKGSPR